jgi:hypothetical protein
MALLIAHPGHELRLHGWLERERPLVLVLTDGSGRTGVSRLPSTLRVLERAGARPGPVLGRFRDRDLYGMLLAGANGPLAGLVEEIAAALADAGIQMMAGDAAEGINPSHDLCRLIGDAAALRAERQTGRAIALYDFLLDGRPDRRAAGTLCLELDAAALERKMAAAHAYPEMAGEVAHALDRYGVEPFRIECLRPVDPWADLETLVDDPPFYERHGEERVAAGHYREVLRLREHFLPAARLLRELARAG